MTDLLENLKNLDMVPLKSLIDKMKNGYSGTQVLEETEYKVSRIETISDGTVNLEKVGFVEKNDKLNEYKLECGDLLFSNINSLAMVGKTAIFDFDQENLYAGMNLLMIRPKQNVDSKWLYYVVNSYYFNQLVKANAKHAINQVSIPTSKIKELPVVFVNYQEQVKIKKYLDSKILLIDQLIKAKESLIEKISQQRQSIITEAVTKGLNPNVKMKDSGVEWIGGIPEHWLKSRIDFISRVKARLGWKGLKAEEYVEEGYAFLATPNLKFREIDFKNVNYITEERYLESPEIMLEVGDVLLAKDGSTLGIVNVVRDLPLPTTVNSSIAVIRPTLKINSVYYYYYLKSTYIQDIINQIKDGMGVPHLFQADIKKFTVLLPPLEEQAQIAHYLDSEILKIDNLISNVKLQIEKLKVYRQALIYEVVTGKIDDLELD